MKKKTKEKLLKRFEALSLHHVDTSVIDEPKITETGRQCIKYLQLVGYKYRGKFSLPVLGEIFLKIAGLKTLNEKYTAVDIITEIIESRKITFYVPKTAETIVTKIKELDNRIKHTDAEILAAAVEDKAHILVTLDEDLIHNQVLERKFNIKIRHPKELI